MSSKKRSHKKKPAAPAAALLTGQENIGQQQRMTQQQRSRPTAGQGTSARGGALAAPQRTSTAVDQMAGANGITGQQVQQQHELNSVVLGHSRLMPTFQFSARPWDGIEPFETYELRVLSQVQETFAGYRRYCAGIASASGLQAIHLPPGG